MKMNKKFWIGLVAVVGLAVLISSVEMNNLVAGIVVGICVAVLVVIWRIKRKRQNKDEKKL